MKRIIPIVGVVLLIGLLTLVNRGINKTAHPDTDDDAAPAQQTTPQKPAPPRVSTDTPTGLPPEITIGDPNRAKFKITVGWVYDDANQSNPKALTDALQAVQKAAQDSGGTVSAEIIDLDTPPGDLSPLAGSVSGLGISLNGQHVIAATPGTSGATASEVKATLQRRLAGK